ncbi:MAG: sigma-70 family RNA polymerase sigma factor [Prevotellaceae bacterium]|jgi:RNA polymerase sigma-70 factor (ECF subfamily)|nr:sigma-70 family RNA polymerase sigma factor [Prevotellaceae bacterium]
MGTYNEQEIFEMLQDERQRNQAFCLLVKQNSEKLYWQIRKMVLNHDDANDVLQNTFIKAWNAVSAFRGESKISTWLYRIATNETLTFLNSKRAENISGILELEDVLVQRLEADTYFSGEEAQMRLQKAILTLPEKQRLVFNMKYFDDMKYEEMSDVLGTSVGALKASYHLAVQKIEKNLTAD